MFIIKFATARAKARKEKIEKGSVQPPPDLAVPIQSTVTPPPDISSNTEYSAVQ